MNERHHWLDRAERKEVERWKIICFVVSGLGAIGWILALAIGMHC